MIDLGQGAGWRRPFFLMPLSQVTIVEDESIPTAEAFDDGTIRVNPKYLDAAGSERDARALFVLYHNLMHLLSLHGSRMGARVPEVWGAACDMVTNTFLQRIGIILPKGSLTLPSNVDANVTAEDVYDKLMKGAQEMKPQPVQVQSAGKGSAGQGGGAGKEGEGAGEGEGEGEGQGSKKPAPGAGCLPSPGQGQGGGQKGEDGGDGHAERWLQIAAQAAQAGIGDSAGNLFVNALKRRPLGMRLDRFVRGACSRAAAEHGKDDQTWTRRRRNAPPYLVLPGYRAVRARVCICIDASGSVSDQMLGRAVDVVDHLARIADARIFLVVHDVRVVFAGWLDGRKRTTIERALGGRGGTAFDAAYARIAQGRATFDVLAHCTDSEVGFWPAKPANCRRLLVGLLKPNLYKQPPAGSSVVRVEM
jgi:predicted metal-dependent peptidase